MCSPTNSNNKTTNDKKFDSLVGSFKGCQIKKKEVTSILFDDNLGFEPVYLQTDSKAKNG